MNTYKTYLESRGFSNTTIQSNQNNLLQYINWSEDSQIEAEQSSYNEVLGYVHYLKKKGLQQGSIQASVNSLRHYFNWLIHRGVRKENPVINMNIKGIKRRTLHNIFNKQELEKLYNDYKKLPVIKGNYPTRKLSRNRNEILLSLLIYQGITTTELYRLTTKDVKLREGKIYIANTRKSNERTLKLEFHQILDIMEYTLQTRQKLLELTGKQTDLLFISIGKSKDLHNVITKLVQQLKKLNKKVTSLNQIRTSVITNWLKMYNLREAQYMAGHRYVSSTEAYLINDLEDLQEDINKYHPVS